MDILSLDATDQLQALAALRISARELLEASVARTDRLNPKLNAVVSRDLDRAYASARMIDERRARGETLGLLGGLPMTVKDTFDVEGLPASAGMKALLDRTAEDAAVVARVRSADAIVWGKTNTPVYASDWQTYNSLYGTTSNPWDLTRTPGGSSGGSAAAVAAGITALEIGADIGGSMRIPASFCGVFAHKPTYGLVSQRGLVPPPGIAADLDLAVVGPMARSARDLRLLLSIIGESPIPAQAPPAELKRLNVALWLDEPTFTVDADTKATVEAFARSLEATGAIVDQIACPVSAERLMYTYILLLYAIIGAELPCTQAAELTQLALAARDERLAGKLPPYVLYLRPFATTGRLPWRLAWEDRKTIEVFLYGGKFDFESLLGKSLRDGTPPLNVYAIGGSGGIGADKLSIGNEEWKALFTILAKWAHALVLCPFDRPGTRWEIDEILKNPELLAKTIFVLPPARRLWGRDLQASWEQSRRRLRERIPEFPPYCPGPLVFALRPADFALVTLNTGPLSLARLRDIVWISRRRVH
jgi:Asp-tRNA(Asn)/Glu-tRNA(Gln) amidotransferase A subunit family amidase